MFTVRATAVIGVLLLCCLSTIQTNAAPTSTHGTNTLLEQLRETTLKSRGLTSGFTCGACKVVVNLLQELFAKDASEDEIAKIITRVCIDLKIEDENVCTLVVPTFKVGELEMATDG